MFSRAFSLPPASAASASFHEPTVVTQIVRPVCAIDELFPLRFGRLLAQDLGVGGQKVVVLASQVATV